MTTFDTETLRQLHSRILEAPNDDTPRLLYADELMELDTPDSVARAEFIRVQVRLAEIERQTDSNEWHNTGACSPYCELCPELRGLNERESHCWGHGFGGLEIPAGLLSIALHIVGTPDYSVGVVRRGFVASVRCRLADWVGGPCERCGGRGGWETGPHAEDCRHCNATGRTPAHGPRIVAEQPVAEVATEKRPLRYEGRFLWHNAEHRFTSSDYDGDDRPADHLPAVVFMSLVGFNSRQRAVTDAVRGYPTEAAAQSALSLALVNWARREAGLPPLEDRR